VQDKQRRVHALRAALDAVRLTPTPAVNAALAAAGQPTLKTGGTASELVRRPEMRLEALAGLPMVHAQVDVLAYPAEVREQVEIGIKYEGYVARQAAQLTMFDRLEAMRLPKELPYDQLAGLSREVVQKLSRHRPANLGQASRISGITPAAITLLAAWLKGQDARRRQAS
jgi:tRNA uridine 5-carboxymethylaminomethyl modification enzyme